MNTQYVLADRGTTVDIAATVVSPRWLIVAHAGSLRSQGIGQSIWIQLRGRSQLVAREGRFDLRRGDWIVLDRDSAPDISAGRYGTTIGLIAVPQGSANGRRQALLPGSGHMAIADLRIALRLWRNGAAAMREHPRILGERSVRAFDAMARHFALLQQTMDEAISRCPGRSIARKRQVFGRLQRARLYLEGHRERVVRLTELAELTSFSSWYLSKTYHEIYLESPQSASVRLRLEHACGLLADSECSISEVGIACGFDNSCSFARAFRTRYGVTATEYRNAHALSRRSTPRRSDMLASAAQVVERRPPRPMTRAVERATKYTAVITTSDVGARADALASYCASCEPSVGAKIGTRSGLVATRERIADSVM